MRPIYYILNAKGEPEPCDDYMYWMAWFENDERRQVRVQRFRPYKYFTEVTVSTIFLGIDHDWQGLGPVLWETMVFGPEELSLTRRYRSLRDAIVGHNEIVRDLGGPVLEDAEGGTDE